MKLSESNLSLSVMLMAASFGYLTSVAMDRDLIPVVEAPVPPSGRTVAAAAPKPFEPLAPLRVQIPRRQPVTAFEDRTSEPAGRRAGGGDIPEPASNPRNNLAALDKAPPVPLPSVRIVPKPKPQWFAEVESVPSVPVETAAILPQTKPVTEPAAKPADKKQDGAEPQTRLAALPPPAAIPAHRKPRVTWNWRLAYLDYCDRNPKDCGVFEQAPLIDWTADRKLLNTSWREVWESLWPAPDQVGDTWGIGSDCEDYALALRAELVKEGLPRYHLLMATGRALDGTNKKHAVLIMRTTDGWKVADGNYPNILSEKTAGRVFFCESLEDPDRGDWVKCPALDKGQPEMYVGF